MTTVTTATTERVMKKRKTSPRLDTVESTEADQFINGRKELLSKKTLEAKQGQLGGDRRVIISQPFFFSI